jgi:pimeloyl-ACP methyl ester carboxylesterase
MTDRHRFVLVPGFWLGAWAWDDVAAALRADGHDVQAVTLPGLEGPDADRAGITLDDHVGAVVAALGEEPERPAVLVGHSGAGVVVDGAVDRAPDLVRRVVYVDSGPMPVGVGVRPDLPQDVVELPLPPWEELAAGGTSLEGLDDEQLATFRRRAVPHPAAPARDGAVLKDPRSRQVPVTLVACSFRPEQVRALVEQGHPWFAALGDLDVTIVDLPTGHWPMWSRPRDLAGVLAAQR